MSTRPLILIRSIDVVFTYARSGRAEDAIEKKKSEGGDGDEDEKMWAMK